jgi:Glucodextranase, domain B/FecR protein
MGCRRRRRASWGPPPTGEPGAGDGAALFRLIASHGEVEAFRDGQWSPIPRGDLLQSTDVVRTSPGARAVLSLGASTEIELKENVEIRLDRLSKTEVSVDLLRGKVFARVPRAGDHLTVTASDTRTSNDGPTHFIVKADEAGRVSVAATEGRVRFLAGGKEVIVREGTETRSERGGVPAEPERIPEAVLLRVVWPEAERHAAKVPVMGSVNPSSAATINGTPVPVGPNGQFSASIVLQPGSNEVKIEAEDLAGRRIDNTATLVRVPARPPDLTAVPTPLWKHE